jgi:hypothetical protein
MIVQLTRSGVRGSGVVSEAFKTGCFSLSRAEGIKLLRSFRYVVLSQDGVEAVLTHGKLSLLLSFLQAASCLIPNSVSSQAYSITTGFLSPLS